MSQVDHGEEVIAVIFTPGLADLDLAHYVEWASDFLGEKPFRQGAGRLTYFWKPSWNDVRNTRWLRVLNAEPCIQRAELIPHVGPLTPDEIENWRTW